MTENMNKEYYQETKQAYKQLEEAIRAAGFQIQKGLSPEAKKELSSFIQNLEDLAYSEQVQADDEIENIEYLESQRETA